MRVEVLPGAGTALRFGDLVVWTGPAASAALIAFLLQSARNVAHAADSGRQVADHVAGILASRDPEPGAPFAAVGPDGHGWVTILHGPVQAWDGTRWLAPTPSPGWLRAVLAPGPAVSVGPAGSPSPRLVIDSPYDLVSGMVPGGGVIVVPGAPGSSGPAGWSAATSSPPPQAAAPAGFSPPYPPQAGGPTADRRSAPRPSAPGAPGGSTWAGAGGTAPAELGAPAALGAPVGAPVGAPAAFGGPPAPDVQAPTGGPGRHPAPIDLRNATAPAAPLPVGAVEPPSDRPSVEGASCERGHLNRPGAPVCWRCRLPVGHDAPPATGLRPSLGVLVADDGRVYRLTADLLLGADPTADPAVVGARLVPVALAAPGGALAPAHTEIRLQGWDVAVVDRGAASGTFVAVAGEESWERLVPFEARPLGSSSHLSLGGRVLTYLSPWAPPG